MANRRGGAVGVPYRLVAARLLVLAIDRAAGARGVGMDWCAAEQHGAQRKQQREETNGEDFQEVTKAMKQIVFIRPPFGQTTA